jgi:LysM repeat protein
MKYLTNRFLFHPGTRRPRLGLAFVILTILICGTIIAEGRSGALGDHAAQIDFNLETDPPGALLRVDGVPIGKTPWSGILKAGNHWLVLEREGYLTIQREVRLPLSEPSVEGNRLQLELIANQKTVHIDSEPTGSEAYVDGVLVGVTPWRGTVSEAGHHQIVVRRPGYEAARREVEISEDQGLMLSVILEPRKATLYLRVRSDEGRQQHALAWVDGVVVGWCPLEIDLPVGTHRVEIREPTGKKVPVVKRVEIGAGEYKREVIRMPRYFSKNSSKEGQQKHFRRHVRQLAERWLDLPARYVVQEGDDLAVISELLNVDAQSLTFWNPNVNEPLKVGSILKVRTHRDDGAMRGPLTRNDDVGVNLACLDSGKVGAPGFARGGISETDPSHRERRIIGYRVKPGDIAESVAAEFGDHAEDILRRNRIKRRTLPVGRRILVHARGHRVRGRALGSPNRGRMILPERLPVNPGYILQRMNRSYATSNTIDILHSSFRKLHACYPGSPPVLVGDLSQANGGRLRPHRSHQNGLDGDIAYVPSDPTLRGTFFRAVRQNMDVVRTWQLLKTLIDSGEVEYIFVNRSVQKVLYDHAKDSCTPDELRDLFQYPRHSRRGIIRHSRGHDDHFHVRFKKAPRNSS